MRSTASPSATLTVNGDLTSTTAPAACTLLAGIRHLSRAFTHTVVGGWRRWFYRRRGCAFPLSSRSPFCSLPGLPTHAQVVKMHIGA